MKFELNSFHRNISEQEILSDLKTVHLKLKELNKKMTFRSYSETGRFSASTISTRFGSWNAALVAAGITPNEEKSVTEIALMENLEAVWILKGSQPVYRDMNDSPSKYSASLYSDRFGSWKSALIAFVTFVNESQPENSELDTQTETPNPADSAKPAKHKTSRNISERMRFRVLMRDGFSCQACGRSPTTERGVELHVDHVLPWSKGGETIEENLQTKCSRCNLGKGNAFDQ